MVTNNATAANTTGRGCGSGSSSGSGASSIVGSGTNSSVGGGVGVSSGAIQISQTTIHIPSESVFVERPPTLHRYLDIHLITRKEYTPDLFCTFSLV